MAEQWLHASMCSASVVSEKCLLSLRSLKPAVVFVLPRPQQKFLVRHDHQRTFVSEVLSSPAIGTFSTPPHSEKETQVRHVTRQHVAGVGKVRPLD